MRIQRLALACVLLLAPAFAAANVLYKSVDEKGVVTFSDQPPPPSSRVLEERPIPSGSPGTGHGSLIVMSTSNAVPAPLSAAPAENLLKGDAAVARANAALDEAERALAEARRSAGSPLEAMKLQRTRLTPEEDQRLENHKKNVKIARQALMELLRERRYAAVRAVPEDGAPRYGELRPLSSRPPIVASR